MKGVLGLLEGRREVPAVLDPQEAIKDGAEGFKAWQRWVARVVLDMLGEGYRVVNQGGPGQRGGLYYGYFAVEGEGVMISVNCRIETGKWAELGIGVVPQGRGVRSVGQVWIRAGEQGWERRLEQEVRAALDRALVEGRRLREASEEPFLKAYALGMFAELMEQHFKKESRTWGNDIAWTDGAGFDIGLLVKGLEAVVQWQGEGASKGKDALMVVDVARFRLDSQSEREAEVAVAKVASRIMQDYEKYSEFASLSAEEVRGILPWDDWYKLTKHLKDIAHAAKRSGFALEKRYKRAELMQDPEKDLLGEVVQAWELVQDLAGFRGSVRPSRWRQFMESVTGDIVLDSLKPRRGEARRESADHSDYILDELLGVVEPVAEAAEEMADVIEEFHRRHKNLKGVRGYREAIMEVQILRSKAEYLQEVVAGLQDAESGLAMDLVSGGTPLPSWRQ